MPDLVSVYHCGNERRLAIGKRRDMEKAALAQERDEEDQRCLRRADPGARQLYYLVPRLTRDVSGFYKPLNDRLRALDRDSRLSLASYEIATSPFTDLENEHERVEPALMIKSC